MKIGLAMVLLGLAAQASAEPVTPVMSSIRVMGEGLVTTSPDRVRINVGVVTQAQRSQVAAAQNAQQLDSVLTALRKLLGAGADIKTSTYSLDPNYEYPAGGGAATLTGYKATNLVRITLDDLPRIGAVIDTATGAGANSIESIQFMLRDPQAARLQALREAALAGRAEADALAAALNLKIVRVLSAETGRVAAQPMMTLAAMVSRKGASAEATPIQPGTLDVSAEVTLTVEVAPR